MDANTHEAMLARLCGHLLTRPGKVKSGYSCRDLSSKLFATFRLDIERDTPSIHPTRFCHSCRKGVDRQQAASKEGKAYTSSIRIVEWSEHTDDCQVCVVRGGRPKKNQRGRSISVTTIINHIQEITADSALPSAVDKEQLTNQELTCRICLEIVICPIELTKCKALVCASCCTQWLAITQSLVCPCCYSEHLRDVTTLQPASPIVRMVLREYEEQVQANSIIDSILQSDVTKPLSPLEERLLTKLAKRSISNSEGNALRIKTGGQVCTCMYAYYVLTSTRTLIFFVIHSTATGFYASLVATGSVTRGV